MNLTVEKLDAAESSFASEHGEDVAGAVEAASETSILIVNSSMMSVVTGAVKALHQHPNGLQPIGLTAVILNILALGIQWGIRIAESDQLNQQIDLTVAEDTDTKHAN